MIAVGVLTTSIVLQLVAAGLALSLIRVTGWRVAWLSVSAALILMSLRRGITLYRAVAGEAALSPDLAAEFVALAISVLMVTGIALFAPLLTRAKQVERELRRSEQRLRAVIEHAPCNITLMDAEGRHLLAGPQSKALWGVDRHDIIGQTTHQLLPKELADSLIAQDRAVLETGRVIEQEDDIVLDDGVHTILTIKFPIPDAEADRPGIGAVSLDITGRKRIEAEVRRLNEELASRIEARTSELHATREALVRNQSLAVLGELTGSVAYDLRNPLGAIATSIDVIQNKCQAAKVDVDHALVRVQRNIRRCDGLIRELLDFTRVKGLHPEPTELDSWLWEVLEEQPVPTWITVNRELRAGGATVAFDREQIRRAVTNVLENACQAMAIDEDTSGGTSRRQLTVATRRSQGRIEIEVADTGPGIPEQVLSKVLEPLFSTKSLGTGLGLPIVQRIMERHSGGLEIASAAQRGTQVRLWLPLAQATEQGAPA